MRAGFLQFLLIAAAMNSARADELPLLLSDNFESGMSQWKTRDSPGAASSFAVVNVPGPAGTATNALRALGTSTYEPPFRSPPNFVLLNDVSVGDFDITAKVQSTRPNAGPHRDMCIFWGYQDPTHFYYAHLGATSDLTAGQIFIVDGADRRRITFKEGAGTPWTNGWHNVKVSRRVEDGTTNVYFDNMDVPFFSTQDTTFAWGQVGLGTFDDHGNWDDFTLNYRLFIDLAGDFNGDGRVDDADLGAWRESFEIGSAAGDADGDADADGADFLTWQRRLDPSQTTPLPEPSSAVLAIAWMAALRRRRRVSHSPAAADAAG